MNVIHRIISFNIKKKIFTYWLYVRFITISFRNCKILTITLLRKAHSKLTPMKFFIDSNNSFRSLKYSNCFAVSWIEEVILWKLSSVPAHFRVKFQSATVRKGETVHLKCSAFGEKPITVVWTKDRQIFNIRAESRYVNFSNGWLKLYFTLRLLISFKLFLDNGQTQSNKIYY